VRELAALFFGSISGLFLSTDAHAGVFGGAKDPIEDIKNDMEEKKTAEQLELEKRLQAIEDASKGKDARVVVLQVSDTNFTNETLQRNIKARIARADAKFYPEIDLYQAGRREPDRTLRPVDQRARVPDDSVARVLSAVEDVASIPWNALSDQDWGLKANELYQLSNEVWFADRAELREPLFLLYAQIGQAAESSNNPTPPYYSSIGNTTVNYFWYLAGSLAYKEPELLSKITNQSLNQSVTFYKDMLDAGQLKFLELNFRLDSEDEFDPKAFATDYTLYINGLEETVKNSNGILEVPPGRVDVYLKRSDGHSLSDRVDLERLTEKFYFVRGNAQRKMGIDFVEQLMDHPSECIPDIDGDILAYLSIYAKLHPLAEVYIAVPKAGSVAPGHIFLWRWDRAQGHLVLVRDNTGGFPVRFAALISTGLNFAGVKVEVPGADEVEGAVGSQNPPTGTENPAQGVAQAVLPEPTPVLDGIPFKYTLRGHYNHFMAAVGMQYKIGIPGQDTTQVVAPSIDEDGKAYYDFYPAHPDDRVLLDCNPNNVITTTNSTSVPTTTDPGSTVTAPTGFGRCAGGGIAGPAFRERNLQRLVFMQLGGMLGRDASAGWGLRGFVQMGWTNVPYALDTTFHAGYTAKVGKDKPGKRDEEDRLGRVRFILDVDFYGGFWSGMGGSIYRLGEKNLLGSTVGIGKPYGTFGFDAGAGLTF
jgi:hypothetical protein